VVRWIALGCVLNGMAHVSYAALQGAGRPDLTAKVHMLEVVPYLAVVWILTGQFGIAGTAVAWAGRCAVDFVLLHVLARRHHAQRGSAGLGRLWMSLVGVLLLGLTFLPMPLAAKAAFLVVVVVGEALLTWGVMMERDGLAHLKQRIRSAAHLGAR
jgi:O-antigen/teichoic acid export membrane protein